MLVQVVYLLLSAQVAVTRQGDNLHPRSHHEECHVKPYLVVARTSRTVSYGVSTYLVSIASYGQCLKDTLRRNRNRIAVVTQYVAIHHVLQRLLVILLRNVESHILHCAQLVGVFLVGLQLPCREATRVGASGIHLVTVLRQLHHCVRGIQTSTKCYYNFFLSHIFFYFLLLTFYFILLI